MTQLVLSLFPGIGLLDMAFEEQGFCVVRGPDALWGGDIQSFHPPPGKFSGVIGGPPCQCFSRLRYLNPQAGRDGNLIPEFERCVLEAQPEWFLMENVPAAPEPEVEGYTTHSFILNNRWIGGPVGAEQNRKRRFSFGVRGAESIDLCQWIDFAVFENPVWSPAVCASGGVKPGIPEDNRTRARYLGWKTEAALQESLRLQGLPADFLDNAPFTITGKHQVVGNAVPLPMGRAVAKAIGEQFGGCWRDKRRHRHAQRSRDHPG